MLDARELVVVAAGLASGAILGACIPTGTERRVRSGNVGWNPFSMASLLGIVLNQLFWMALVGAALTAVIVAILTVGKAYPLRGWDGRLLGGAWLAGAGLAKWMRYRYWKSRDPWA
jgi:hypothetical protein